MPLDVFRRIPRHLDFFLFSAWFGEFHLGLFLFYISIFLQQGFWHIARSLDHFEQIHPVLFCLGFGVVVVPWLSGFFSSPPLPLDLFMTLMFMFHLYHNSVPPSLVMLITPYWPCASLRRCILNSAIPHRTLRHLLLIWTLSLYQIL